MIKVSLIYNRKTVEGYSLYLRYYCTESQKVLKSETLGLAVSQKYKRGETKIKLCDRQQINIANDILLKRKAEVLEGRFSIELIEKQKKKVDVMAEIFKEVEAKKHRTYNAMFSRLKDFVLSGGKYNDISGFQDFLLNTSLSQTSVSHYVKRLRIILNILNDKKIISFTDGGTKIVPVNHKNKIYLDAEQIAKIASIDMENEKGDITKYGYLFSCFTGLRMSDLLNLKFENVVSGVMRIEITKGGRFNEFPLGEISQSIISIMREKYGDEPGQKIFPINVANYKRYLEKLNKKANLGFNFTSHSGRHSFATSMLENGVDIYTIQQLMGHTRISSTEVYAHLKTPQKLLALNKIQRIDLK